MNYFKWIYPGFSVCLFVFQKTVKLLPVIMDGTINAWFARSMFRAFKIYCTEIISKVIIGIKVFLR